MLVHNERYTVLSATTASGDGSWYAGNVKETEDSSCIKTKSCNRITLAAEDLNGMNGYQFSKNEKGEYVSREGGTIKIDKNGDYVRTYKDSNGREITVNLGKDFSNVTNKKGGAYDITGRDAMVDKAIKSGNIDAVFDIMSFDEHDAFFSGKAPLTPEQAQPPIFANTSLSKIDTILTLFPVQVGAETGGYSSQTYYNGFKRVETGTFAGGFFNLTPTGIASLETNITRANFAVNEEDAIRNTSAVTFGATTTFPLNPQASMTVYKNSNGVIVGSGSAFGGNIEIPNLPSSTIKYLQASSSGVSKSVIIPNSVSYQRTTTQEVRKHKSTLASIQRKINEAVKLEQEKEAIEREKVRKLKEEIKRYPNSNPGYQ